MNDDQYLDAISAPSVGKVVRKKSHKQQDTIDISDSDSDHEAESAMDTAP